MAAPCPICARRKPRRFCPARQEEICPVCCGTKRLVEIPCPPDCPYLQSAQRHPSAAMKRQQDEDVALILGPLGPLSERQLQLFFLVHTVVARFAPPSVTRFVDRDVSEAAGALAATFETADKGLIYEHRAESPVAEALRQELRTVLTELGKNLGSAFEREAANVLRAVETGANTAQRLAGASERAYLDRVARLLEQVPAPEAAAAAPSPSPIVLP